MIRIRKKMAASMQGRDSKGRFTKSLPPSRKKKRSRIIIDHNYSVGHVCNGTECGDAVEIPQNASRDSWKKGRRIIELDSLLSELKYCKKCFLGPVPLTYDTIVGELKKGLGGYLYVVCSNVDCRRVNKVAYGKTYRVKKYGMPCFSVNTKLGTAMIDSIGGPDKVNNMLSTLNIPPISGKNLKSMERRAGEVVEEVARKSTQNAAIEAFRMEMQDAAKEESEKALATMGPVVEDLGVCPLPDASPSIRQVFSTVCDEVTKDHAADQNKGYSTGADDDEWEDLPNEGNFPPLKHPSYLHKMKSLTRRKASKLSNSTKRALQFPCKARSGMTVAVDTAWQKRGFDSLTCEYNDLYDLKHDYKFILLKYMC
ncbi:uncharacterized protein LOC125677956 isoform X1 [Ostrea edulis]|uniref:uncharacterized protein LOC125677956 isoform X1 n=1 Tax=Ostrea edulis TaxID=37623 RepID=UPI0024AFA148|nr:uncharacterized protein LOC125677956 isoform X1 [Ostrea edulis]XP_056014140.1 uncharacterized protein LOC125677956 isoform X1 [Ostrea edulis]XP_056014141.1 uncharacterized protein LOC125677956 isoform X1 [Ostrea edulis]XP_056014142.1 uncharacterized protein LOC125677956 isoform X1 [Ostrea edulis]